MVDKKIQIKHKNGEIWDSLFPVTKIDYIESTTGTPLNTIVSDLNTLIETKVTKVTGKGLSTNDYTTTEKDKLSTLTDHTAEIETKVTKVTGKGLSTNDYTTTEKDKLSTLTDHTAEIDELRRDPIPVQATEPVNAELWFEEIT